MVKATPLRVLVVPALALILGAAAWAAMPPAHSVVFADAGRQVTVSGRRLRTVSDAVRLAGIALGPSDRLLPPAPTPLQAGTLAVSVLRAWPIVLDDGGTPFVRYTVGRDVGGALQEWHTPLGVSDRVEPPLLTPLAPGVTIHLTRVRQQTRIVTAEVPYDTERHPDESLGEGEMRELQPGVVGHKEVVLKTTLVNGTEAATDILSEKVVQPPQPRIVAYGTAGVVSRGGQNLRYVRALSLTATGYTAGPESNPGGNGLTYTGIPARRGVVAVDPRVIPLGSRLYIEGYGTALAADTGGAIKGDRIDLCFDSVAEADAFGVRKVQVFVLAN